MSDAAPIPKTPPEDEGQPQIQGPGLLADPVVRIMLFACAGIVILYLLAVIGVLGSGVLQKTGPRSAAEKNLMVAAAELSPQTQGQAWAPYIDALVGAGDFTAARVALLQARASIVGTAPASDLDLAEARLFRAQNNYPEAAKAAGKAMASYKAEKKKVAKGKPAPIFRDGYYDAALVKAYASQKLGEWEEAVAMFDIVLRRNPTASDLLIDRGNAKVQLKDKKGAEKDFRLALKYVPYDQDAKAGLNRIGVAQ